MNGWGVGVEVGVTGRVRQQVLRVGGLMRRLHDTGGSARNWSMAPLVMPSVLDQGWGHESCFGVSRPISFLFFFVAVAGYYVLV